MKKIVVVVLLIVSQGSFGQNQKTIDSLFAISRDLKNVDLKIDTYNKIFEIYNKNSSFDEAEKFITKYSKDIKKNPTKKARLSFMKGIIKYNKFELDSAYFFYKKALKNIKEKTKYSDFEATINLNIGNTFFMKRKIDSTLYYYENAEKIYKDNNNHNALLRLSINQASLALQYEKYNEGIQFLAKSNIYNTSIKDPFFSGFTNYLYGEVYLILFDYDLSRKHFTKAINYFKKTNSHSKLALSYCGKAMALSKLGKASEAKIYSDKAYQIIVEEKLPTSPEIITIYLTCVWIDIENKKELSANEHLEVVRKMATSINYTNLNNIIAIGEASILLHKEDLNKAEEIINEIYLVEKNLSNEELLRLYEVSQALSFKKYNFQKAFLIQKKYYELKEKIHKDNVQINLNFNKIRFETNKKENEILKLNSEKALQEASLIKSRYTIFGVLGLLLMVLVVGYFYWNKRKQSHQLALLENSVKTSEAEKSRIGKELHDGIAGSIMKLVHDSETAQIALSHKLLETYNEIRSLSHQLDNTPEHGELFLDRVLDLIPESNETQKFNFNITPRHLEISEPNGTHIYRIIQELIANNIKHSKATETNINLSLENKKLTFEYSDNGVGTKSFKKGKGYKNIDDRIILMKGILDINTDNGFTISFQIPYNS